MCLVNFKLNATLCDPKYNATSDNSSSIESLLLESDDDAMSPSSSVTDRVQSYVSTLKIYESVINTLPAIIFALVLGPWSEKNGRKPLMIVPTVGFVLSTFFYMLIEYADSWPAEFLLIAGIPASLLGGWSTYSLAINR